MDEPVPIAESVERLLANLAAPRVDTVQKVFEQWDDIAGPGVAAHTRPVSFEDGCLVIAVDDPAWASQLQWAQERLVDQLRQVVGGTDLDRIRTVVRPDI